MTDSLRAPFPWFGGKSRAAGIIWDRLGDVATYNEPFAGSLAVLLARPHEPRVETVNDLDAMLSNFWRALQHDPEGIAFHADSPVNETDLHARHLWLVSQLTNGFRERMLADPDAYDAKIAGWWVWGQCLWIGSGWCEKPEWMGRCNAGGKARGIHSGRLDQKRPMLRERWHDGVEYRRWQGGGQGGGSGVHAPRLTQQKPLMRGDSGASGIGVHRKLPALSGGGNDRNGNGRGIMSEQVRSNGLYDYLKALALRLRRVRVCCGDWKRILTPSVTTYIGTCGVLLDPPYSQDLRERCYSEDHDISAEVMEWAIANGDNPEMRIALCGYEGEHEMPSTWECVSWKAHGGYSRTKRGKENRERERIWFSPHCLTGKQQALDLE